MPDSHVKCKHIKEKTFLSQDLKYLVFLGILDIKKKINSMTIRRELSLLISRNLCETGKGQSNILTLPDTYQG